MAPGLGLCFFTDDVVLWASSTGMRISANLRSWFSARRVWNAVSRSERRPCPTWRSSSGNDLISPIQVNLLSFLTLPSVPLPLSFFPPSFLHFFLCFSLPSFLSSFISVFISSSRHFFIYSFLPFFSLLSLFLPRFLHDFLPSFLSSFLSFLPPFFLSSLPFMRDSSAGISKLWFGIPLCADASV